MNEEARAEALARVRRFLVEHGASADEIDDAERRGVLDLLVADRMLVPGEARYTTAEVSARTAMPEEVSRRLWRALGFPDVAPDERAFTDLDVEAITTLQAMVAVGAAELDSAVQLARVIGTSMARIADAQLAPAMASTPGVAGEDDTVEEADRFAQLADQIVPAMGRLIEFVWRRHLQAATRRAMLLRDRGGSRTLPDLVVGFADMVGFTGLSQQLSDDELANMVSRFEQVAHDIVTAGGGRIVKMIGDEAMFVAEDPGSGVDVGLQLAEAYADDDRLSDVRVALALGPVLLQDGDFFGPVVNLASRAVGIAAPGTVLVSDDLHRALEGEGAPDPGRFAFRGLRPRTLKDLGRVQLWVVGRPGQEPPLAERRLGRGFERLAEVLHEFDELRSTGERVISAGRRRRVGQPDGGEGLGGEVEGAVDRGDGTPPQVDQPT